MCSRAQFDGLFDKIEDFEGMTLKEYKHFSKLKLKINEKMGVYQSLKFMKEKGNMYSWWKLLDSGGISVIPTLYTGTSHQFCIVENFLTWLSTNKAAVDTDKQFVIQLICNAFKNMSENLNNDSLDFYSTTTQEILKNITDIPSRSFSPLTASNVHSPSNIYSVSHLQVHNWVIGRLAHYHNTGYGQEVPIIDHIQLIAGVIVNENRGTTSANHIASTRSAGNHMPKCYNLQLTVSLFQDKVPEVSVASSNQGKYCYIDPNSLFTYRIFARKQRNNLGPNYSLDETTHIPLYTDPAEAFKLLEQYPQPDSSNNILLPGHRQHGMSNDFVRFGVVCVPAT